MLVGIASYNSVHILSAYKYMHSWSTKHMQWANLHRSVVCTFPLGW